MVICDYLHLVLDQSFNHIQDFHTFGEVGMHVEHILGIPSLLEDIVQLAVASFILFARVLILWASPLKATRGMRMRIPLAGEARWC